MRWNPLHVSLNTLVAASPLLGHELEDRATVRDGQQFALAKHLAFTTSTPLRSSSQRDLFCVAPLDWLVSRVGGQAQFHLLELNGTGIGGLTNLPDDIVCHVLRSLAESTSTFDDPSGVVLLAVSGKESESCPRKNRLMHEKLLFVEAIREGLNRRFGGSDATNVDTLREADRSCPPARPAVVLGYIKDLLRDIVVDGDGVAWLHGRRVMGAVNDRFCRNLLQRFDDRIDLERMQTFNRCFAAGSDKGIAYSLINDYLQVEPHDCMPHEVRYAHADCRESLIETVLDWLAEGRESVIKPHGTGLGHGIEFFLDAHEPVASIVQRIDGSLQQTAEFYGVPGGALPYTVCEYVDASRVRSPSHPLDGHRYELRVVVYRQGLSLRAFPSIAKIARERDDAGGNVRRALINNITASGDTPKVRGTDYMLPLCNEQTLAMLDLSLGELEAMCQAATRYVRHVLDQVEDQPGRFGLPVRRTVPGRVAPPIAAALPQLMAA